MAIDRKQMSDTFLAGLSPVADSFVNPSSPSYRTIEPGNREIPIDAGAGELIEGLGYTKGSDGIYQDASGAKLIVEDRTTAGDDVREKYLLSIADYWKQAGIGAETVIIRANRHRIVSIEMCGRPLSWCVSPSTSPGPSAQKRRCPATASPETIAPGT